MTDTGRQALPGLDMGAFGPWFARELGLDSRTEFSATLIAGGKSNLTYAVSDGSRSWVVRRPPLGHVLPTAHNMSREFNVISALRDTQVPVPRAYVLCSDLDIIGAPFFVMGRSDGVIYRYADELAARGVEEVEVVAHGIVDTLVALHSVDPQTIGLHEFGRPEGFLKRQVARWHAQMEASSSRPLPAAAELHSQLASSIPDDSGVAILHGDYKLDNVLIGAAGTVSAVLDWEMATLGDPLTDVALLLAYRSLADLIPARVGSNSMSAPGFPSSDSLLRRYAAGSGRDLSHFAFYLGLANFKLAAILEGVHFRHSRGQTVGGGFGHLADLVPPLLEAGLNSLKEYR